MSRSEKGGLPDGGQDGRNGLVARGCRGLQVSGKQVDCGKTASEGQAVEAGGMEACLGRRSKTGTRVENLV